MRDKIEVRNLSCSVVLEDQTWSVHSPYYNENSDAYPLFQLDRKTVSENSEVQNTSHVLPSFFHFCPEKHHFFFTLVNYYQKEKENI